MEDQEGNLFESASGHNVFAAHDQHFYGGAPNQRAIDPNDPKQRHNLPRPLDRYIERSELLDELHQLLIANKQGVLGQTIAWGEGGQGKTTLAIAYARAYGDLYPGGRFVLSATKSLAAQFADLATYVGIPLSADTIQTAKLVHAKIDHGPPALIVVDNVEGPEQWSEDPEFQEYLLGLNCHLLITTRSSELHGSYLRVGAISPDQSVALLSKFRPDATESTNQEAIRKIVSETHGLTVAMAAVGAYMSLPKNRSITWEAYATKIAERELSCLDNIYPVAHLGGYPNSVVGVLDDLFDSLEAIELRALEYAAVFGQDAVPAAWLEMLLVAAIADGEVQAPLRPGTEGKEAVACITTLTALGLLPVVDEANTILRLHAIHRKRLRERNTSTGDSWEQILNRCGSLGGVLVSQNQEAAADRLLRWTISPLIALAQSLLELGQCDDALNIANCLTKPIVELARFAEGKSLLESFSGKDDNCTNGDIGSRYSNLSAILVHLGDPLGAKQSILKAIEIESRHFEPDHPTLAVSYSNLASILRGFGDLQGAKLNILKAIEIDSKVFESDHPTLATRYSNLSTILKDLGDLDGAKLNILKAVEIDTKNLGPYHPKLAIRYSVLATILRASRDPHGAKQNILRAIEIDSAILEPDHPTLAIRYSNLSTILIDLGDLEGARQNILKAIEIDAKVSEPDHPRSAITLNNLAYIEYELGNRDTACELWHRALTILRKHFSDDHPQIRAILNAVSQMCEG